ncbi:uncharacterized protein K452DRAFT_349190 [Aplosporella prunicola CBS 121167]|uniref:Luciferase domain-containing protein n=1 Tax=Aplosporella prunicola CBS 121167 TaxID=1176127 RepID=A0A6A6BT09_9PEZI|nr:uncharacterized protein K452DRAFT_349190 [Aplosporella prunicola CBS 121167]KAF2145741.1 hypothetical protein K452DRAFT_349190 [Aplosporella prunicola CBS 121167]
MTILDSATLQSFLALFVAVALIPPAIYLIHRDYCDFLSLGAGGTPQTPVGYLKVKFLGLFALPDPCVPHFLPHEHCGNGYLTSLPQRTGRRPQAKGIAPHRQMTQRSPKHVHEVFAEALRDLARDPRNLLVEGTSCFEKHGTGLFSLRPRTRTCRGEVCHVHGSDGSLHMTLYPADAKLVIERGWGERHPLARGGWLARFVPKHFVMVYAPRNEEEVGVVTRIASAAVWWVSGITVHKNGTRDDRSRSDIDNKAIDVARETSGEGHGSAELVHDGLEKKAMVGDGG